MELKISRAKQLRLEGKCPACGEFAFPYYYCHKCRITKNTYRVLKNFEKYGWVDIRVDPLTNKKLYRWNDKAPQKISKNYSPESIAKMSLPRLSGKPMTEDFLNEIILDVLQTNNMPLTIREIERGVKSLKLSGKIIPETSYLVEEYKKVQLKSSQLSKNERNGVEIRVNFLLKRGVINQSQLTF